MIDGAGAGLGGTALLLLLLQEAQGAQQVVNQPIVVGALIAAIYALVEAMKFRSAKRNNDVYTQRDRVLSQGDRELSQEDRQMLTSLVTLHNKTDDSGAPMVFFPRKLIVEQLEISKTLRDELVRLNQVLIQLERMQYRREDGGRND
jgi:hypothetical protein